MYFVAVCCNYYSSFVDLEGFLRLNSLLNPFAPGDFAEKRILKLVEWFSGHCHAILGLKVTQQS